MTTALPSTDCAPRLHDSIHLVRSVISSAGCGLPAAALQDHAVADWVRKQGVTVVAAGDDDLELLQYSGIRPSQAVFRCGPVTDSIRRAVNLGVTHFIVSTAQQIAGLTACAQRTKHVYLDGRAPLVLGDRRLNVVGLHTDVDDSGGTVEWASAAERLLCRAALLKTCGSPITRIMLSGGPADVWLKGDAPQLTTIAHAVDDALHDGCERWHVTRPAVSLAPLTGPSLQPRPRANWSPSVVAGSASAASFGALAFTA